MSHLVIVCPSEFLAACDEYARFKRTMGVTCHLHVCGMNNLLWPQEEVSTANVNALPVAVGGRSARASLNVSPTELNEPAIRLKAQLARHFLDDGTRHVLLAGDVDKVPVPWIEFRQDASRFFYPSDLFYADLFRKQGSQRVLDTWDPDKDFVKGEIRADQVAAIDWNPDIAVGRIPASTAVELERAFDRLMTREARAPRCLVLQGNDPSHGPWLMQVASEATGALRAHQYDVTSLTIPPNASPAAAQIIESEVHDRLRAGVEYIFWFGHGGASGWGNFGSGLWFPQLVPETTGSPVVFSTSCDVGAYFRGVYGATYYSGGELTTPVQIGAANEPAVPDALQPPPSTIEGDFAPEEWIVRHTPGATALLAGHSWGSLGDEHLKKQPLDFIRMLPSKGQSPVMLGVAFKQMLEAYLATYREELVTSGLAVNHLLRMHLFGDPTTPLFV